MATYKIVSWDVGIKNLAFCILEKTGDNYSIKKWDIINLINSNELVCKELQKNKSVCNKKATYVGTNLDGTTHYYCKTHMENYVPLPEGWQDTYMKDLKEVKTCDYLLPKKNCNCGKKALFSNSNLNYCKAHKEMIITQREKDFTLKPIKKIKCGTSDPKFISTQMYSKLDAIPELLQVNEVLVENQPSLKNPIMKSISCFLFSYFVMRGITDKAQTNSTIEHVRFYSPSNKLKVNEDNTFEVLTAKKKTVAEKETTENTKEKKFIN